MSDFDDVYLGIEVDPFINFKEAGGNFQFGLVAGFFEISQADSSKESRMKFTWVGSDEMDELKGTGVVFIKSQSEINGVIHFKDGESHDFLATKLVG